mgnify:CR=1 FL=1
MKNGLATVAPFTSLGASLAAPPAHALSGAEYLQLDTTSRALHAMGMVEAFKYADDLSGDGSLGWLFDCVGGWSGTQLEAVFSNYLETRPGSQQYRAPSLLVSAVGHQCPNAPMWAKN